MSTTCFRILFVTIISCVYISIFGCGAMVQSIASSPEDREMMRQLKVKLMRERNDPDNNIEIIHHESWEDAVSEYIYINGKKADSLLTEYPVIEAGFDIQAKYVYIGKLNPGIYLLMFHREDRKLNKNFYNCKKVIIEPNRSRQNFEFGSQSGLMSSSFSQSIQEFNEEYGHNASREILKISGIDPLHDLDYYLQYINGQYLKNLIDSRLKEEKIKKINKYFESFTGNKINAEQLYDLCNSIIVEYMN